MSLDHNLINEIGIEIRESIKEQDILISPVVTNLNPNTIIYSTPLPHSPLTINTNKLEETNNKPTKDTETTKQLPKEKYKNKEECVGEGPTPKEQPHEKAIPKNTTYSPSTNTIHNSTLTPEPYTSKLTRAWTNGLQPNLEPTNQWGGHTYLN